MARRRHTTLANWFSIQNHARNLDLFWETPTGLLAIVTARYEFRAAARDVNTIPNIRYRDVGDLRNAFREGAEAMLELLEATMSVVKEPPKKIEDRGWATEPLRRETEKDESPKVTKKKK